MTWVFKSRVTINREAISAENQANLAANIETVIKASLSKVGIVAIEVIERC